MPASDLRRVAEEIDRHEAIHDLRMIGIETFMSLSGDTPGKTPRHVKEGNRMRQRKLDDLHKRATRGTKHEGGTRTYVSPHSLKSLLAEKHGLFT